MRRSIVLKDIKHDKESSSSSSSSLIDQVKEQKQQDQPLINTQVNIRNLILSKQTLLTKLVGKNSFVNQENTKEAIIDHVLDHLSSDMFQEMIKDVSTKFNNNTLTEEEKTYLKSWVTSGIIHVVNNRIHAYFDPYDGEVYCLKSSQEFKKCNPIDLSKISDFYNVVKERLSEGLRDQTKGYIYVKKDDEAKFKVRDNPKTQGYVCQSTSSLTVEDLRNRIEVLSPKLLINTSVKIGKPGLCFLYEIVNRVSYATTFQRPYFVKFEAKKK
jgi:hypothetical protein